MLLNSRKMQKFIKMHRIQDILCGIQDPGVLGKCPVFDTNRLKLVSHTGHFVRYTRLRWNASYTGQGFVRYTGICVYRTSGVRGADCN